MFYFLFQNSVLIFVTRFVFWFFVCLLKDIFVSTFGDSSNRSENLKNCMRVDALLLTFFKVSTLHTTIQTFSWIDLFLLKGFSSILWTRQSWAPFEHNRHLEYLMKIHSFKNVIDLAFTLFSWLFLQLQTGKIWKQ